MALKTKSWLLSSALHCSSLGQFKCKFGVVVAECADSALLLYCCFWIREHVADNKLFLH